MRASYDIPVACKAEALHLKEHTLKAELFCVYSNALFTVCGYTAYVHTDCTCKAS